MGRGRQALPKFPEFEAGRKETGVEDGEGEGEGVRRERERLAGWDNRYVDVAQRGCS